MQKDERLEVISQHGAAGWGYAHAYGWRSHGDGMAREDVEQNLRARYSDRDDIEKLVQYGYEGWDEYDPEITDE